MCRCNLHIMEALRKFIFPLKESIFLFESATLALKSCWIYEASKLKNTVYNTWSYLTE